MESRTLTKTFSYILPNILLRQNALTKQHAITVKHCISTYRYDNTDNLYLRKNRQPLLINHCSPQPKCSRATNLNILSKRNYITLLTTEPSVRVPVKPFSNKADLESIVGNGIGWAGQPIVKRVHPILPEVYGDVSDIFGSLENHQTNSSYGQKVASAKSKPGSGIPLTVESLREGRNKKVIPSEGFLDSKSREIFNDSISTTIEKGQEFLTNGLVKIHKAILSKYAETKSPNETLPNKIEQVDLNLQQEAPIVNLQKKKKLKKRKKTKVCLSKTVPKKLSNGSSKPLKKSKGKSKPCITRGENHLETSTILTHKTTTHALTNNKMLRIENRQFNTGVAFYYPRSSPKVKEISSGKTTGNGENKMFDDDCICPEVIVNIKRRKTKICGQAAGMEKKKELKKWKPKMCLVESPVKYNRTLYKNRTFVCSSKAFEKEKDKKKRQLPKCIKPEKVIAPRVQICLPNLLDELEKTSKKKCEKPVEEVKIRKRTQVCKPVLLYAKETSEVIKVEKATCVSLKKKESRHTQICPPEKDDKKSNKIQLRN